MSPAPTADLTEPAEPTGSTAPPTAPVDPVDGPGSPRPVLLGTVTALHLIRRAA